ncbi:MAG TPA: ATP-binding protein [Gemmatimonadota bacterium]|nr:ATP-binding protein [Gemmatimonadota bacterium]
MSIAPPESSSSNPELLAKVSRYEALFELADVINAASDVEAVGQVLAHRLKYVADVYAWRYVCLDQDSETGPEPDTTAIIVDGYRGNAHVELATQAALSSFQRELWRERKTRILCGLALEEVLPELPPHLQRDDLEQISINTLVEHGRTQALFLFFRRRHPFTELDLKCLSMVCGFFHNKVHTLWEHQKLRELEKAYLHQEVMLRQSEKLATLGRLSAGMAHELNNPTAVARHGAEQLKASIARLQRAQYALGAADLSGEQQQLVRDLEEEARERAKIANPLDPLERSDLEQEVEDWLADHDVEDGWEYASTLVSMGLCAREIEDLLNNFDRHQAPIVIDYFATQFTAYALLEEIGHGAGRIAEIVKALKGYSYMDQAPLQSVDVREGLNDTLVMLNSRLREGVDVHLDYAEDLPLIQGYGSELNQVWTNLIDNAVDAMDGDGSLTLKAYAEDNRVVVEISDSGPGIPTDVQAKIFDPFFTTKPPGHGTGLGLNISHGIVVEKHGGRISVESTPGSTRFTVRLPIARAD